MLLANVLFSLLHELNTCVFSVFLCHFLFQSKKLINHKLKRKSLYLRIFVLFRFFPFLLFVGEDVVGGGSTCPDWLEPPGGRFSMLETIDWDLLTRVLERDLLWLTGEASLSALSPPALD